MSEPDDVERLVAEIESLPPFHFCNKCGSMYHGGTSRHPDCNYAAAESDQRPKRLARIVRELLAFLPREKGCEFYPFYKYGCRDGQPTEPEGFCDPCRVRRLRERCNRLARGEEA